MQSGKDQRLVFPALFMPGKTVIIAAAGSCSTEVEQDLPVHLIYALENGIYGREYIQRLDSQLLALVAN